MRKAPSAETYKLLFVRSGNECAFPKCNHPLFNDDGLYVAELCHIKSVNKGGPRFDENQTDEQRRNPENLLFMCHRHHKETDDISKYPEETLFEIKRNHESRFMETRGQLSSEMIEQIESESRYYWTLQKEKKFEFDELKMKTNFEFSESELYNEIIEGINLILNYCKACSNSDSSETLEKDLRDLFSKAGLDYRKLEQVPYYQNPFSFRNWEFHNIGLPNLFSNLELRLFQLRVRTFETLSQLNPENKELKSELKKYRKEFDEIYENSYHVD